DLVLALGLHADIEIAGVVGSRAYRVIQCQFFGVTFARKLAQAAQRDFQVARAQFAFGIVILERPLFPYFDRGLVAAFTAYPDAFRVVAAVAEGGGAAGAHPLLAAFVALFLLFQQLLQALPQAVEA